MSLHLKALTKWDGRMIYEMLQEIDDNDHGFKNEVKGKTYEEYGEWLSKNEQFSRGSGLETWMVPQTIYWMYYDQTPVGYGRIRHWLNDNLKENSGHIGYAIPLSQRGKGYGNEILRLLIHECYDLKINPIQIGVNPSNKPSNKIVKRNGGVLHKVSKTKNIYHITL
ncbi:GNAT family N-acetyltransferase [Halobacillus litoralis]|uniref:GNAT family N-acetyltransferase n=1 Tax=Halobacillus litoralis TaxID=45668 RepID=UPI001CFD2A3D|nr:GNAT family N-acetyltransferase [Halobacillus litoralis]